MQSDATPSKLSSQMVRTSHASSVFSVDHIFTQLIESVFKVVSFQVPLIKFDQHTCLCLSLLIRLSLAGSQPQILQSSSGSHQGSLTSPTPAPAPPPAEPRPSQPHFCTDDSPDSPHGLATQGGKDGTQERRGANTRSLQQPSKLRLFLSQNPSSVAMVTKGRCSKQQPQDPEKSSLYSEKMAALTSGSSRLPKPLIH